MSISNDQKLPSAPLERDLYRVGAACRSAALPADRDAQIALALRRHGLGKAPGTGGGRRLPTILRRHRLAAYLGAGVLGISVIMGGSYAAAPVINTVFEIGGASSVLQQDLGKDINLSQTLAGYTMTIKRVYADANRILISYSISHAPTAHRLWNLSANLVVTDGSGNLLSSRGGTADSSVGQPDTTLEWFDAGGINIAHGRLPVHVAVPWIDAMQQLHAPLAAEPSSGEGRQSATAQSQMTFQGAPSSGRYGSAVITRPLGESNPWMQEVRVYGPLSFQFSIPMTPSIQIFPKQAVTGGGVTATLQRVVISPTETRAYVSGLQPNTVATFSGNGWDPNSGGGSFSWRIGGVTVYSFLDNLMNRAGEWTLEIKPMPAIHWPTGVTPPPNSTPARGGPWVFHFQPPVQPVPGGVH
ncbi:MAG: DUF4179 domain-containing protein [Chloroflexota bacterium]